MELAPARAEPRGASGLIALPRTRVAYSGGLARARVAYANATAAIYALIETANLNDIDPQAWLRFPRRRFRGRAFRARIACNSAGISSLPPMTRGS
jgi:hypothetical protein